MSAAASVRRCNLIFHVGIFLKQGPYIILLILVCFRQRDDAVFQIREIFRVLLKCGAPVCHRSGQDVQVSAKGVHHFVRELCRVVGGAEFHGLFGRLSFISCGGNAAKKSFLLPSNVGLTSVGDVDLLVPGFSEVPLTRGWGKLVPSLGFFGVII